jgi:hypothetical protein
MAMENMNNIDIKVIENAAIFIRKKGVFLWLKL